MVNVLDDMKFTEIEAKKSLTKKATRWYAPQDLILVSIYVYIC